jgi:hypothetical protein
MIFKANALGKSFKGLVSYLETGKDGLQTGRVEWAETRNLPTRDPQVAARMMAATSRLSERTQAPVYHFSVSFALEDNVSRDAMRRVADGVLRDLGLEKHQAVVTSHRDTAHQHMHFAVNTVHPETGRAWNKYRDWPRGHESMRRLEKELGLRQVPSPARARQQELQDATPRGPESRSLLDRARQDASPLFRNAKTWGELEGGLAELGMKLKMTGRGMVLTDGKEEVKASDIDPKRSFSRYRMEQRLGSHADYRAMREVAGRGARSEAGSSRPDSGQNQARAGQPSRPAPAGSYRAFSNEFQQLYDDPALARRTFLRSADKEGVDAAAAALRADPRRYGAIRTEAAAHVQERAEKAAGAGRAFAAARADRPRPTLKELKEKLHELDAALQREGKLHDAVQLAARARIERQIAWEQRDRANTRVREMREALPGTYADPAAAARRIWRAARAGEAPESIARDIRNGSERFGPHRAEPKSRLWGLGTKWDKSAARAAAPDTAQRVEAALTAVAQAPRRPELNEVNRRSQAADGALSRARMGGGVSSQVLQQQVGGLMQRLGGMAQKYAVQAMGPIAQAPMKAVSQAQQIAALVKAPHIALAQAALKVVQTRAREDRGGRE